MTKKYDSPQKPNLSTTRGTAPRPPLFDSAAFVLLEITKLVLGFAKRRERTVNIFKPCALFLAMALSFFFVSCGGSDNEDGDVDHAAIDDDHAAVDDDANNPGGDDDSDRLQHMFDEMGYEQYIGIQYTRSTPGPNGYTYYYYSPDDCRCTFGAEMKVAVHPGTANKVMLFMEGGGAEWPGGGFAVALNFPWDIGFKSFDEENPLHDWSFVYLPYCDNSIHSGDSEAFYGGRMHYHHGARQIAAAVTLMLELFPNPEKILVAGSSAGGYGTFIGWGLVKSQYMNTDTYIMNDSGTGFWNPYDPETWEIIKEAWNIHIPSDCTKCQGSIITYLYEVFMRYDPQVRIGMFSSYRDWIISGWFLKMNPTVFEGTLMSITDEIARDYPERFHRFFVARNTHTTYEFLLPGGPKYSIRGTTLYQWIGQLVDEDPAWKDLLE